MSRAIDADAFKAYMRNALEQTRNAYPDKGEWAETITEQFCKDIDDQPTVYPDSDTISRQDAINLIERYCDNGCEIAEDKWCPDCQQGKFAEMIKALPPSPSRPKGKWVFSPDGAEGTCTICQYKIYGRKYQGHYMIVPYNFCPNCGAEMLTEDKG